VALPQDAVVDFRSSHPLARVLPLLDEMLGQTARDSSALMAICDAEGRLLWVSGPRDLLRKAERIGFVEGADWDERAAGTNAPGLALAIDSSVVVKGEEHYRNSMHGWSCAATPIHDPLTGERIGALDITGSTRLITPAVAGLVRATALLAETELARPGAAVRHQHSGAISSQLTIGIEALGRSSATFDVRLPGHTSTCLRLSPRHSEIIFLLADSEEGLTGDEISALLYPDDPGPSTLRAELNRLRHTLGEELLASRPYRLRAHVRSDWQAVHAYLASGDLAAALRRYHGPLLPFSEAPGVVQARSTLHSGLRRAILTSGRSDLLSTWTRTAWGREDYSMWEALLDALPANSPLAAPTAARIIQLDHELRSPRPPHRPGQQPRR
jgi:hypothetical protein